MATHPDDARPGRRTRAFEHLLAAAGAAFVLSAAGVLGYEAVRGNGAPPAIAVEVVATREVPGGYLVQFSVHNRGDATAARVHVEGRLHRGDDQIEHSRATFDYVPARSAQRGGFFFSHDPRTHDLRVRASGYGEP